MQEYIAEAFAKRDAALAPPARSRNGLQNVATRLNELRARTLIMPADLRQSSQCKELISAVIQEFGAIDVLVNNAGLETEGT